MRQVWSWITHQSLKRPVATVVAWLCLGFLSLLPLQRLPLATSNLDLLDPESPQVEQFMSFGRRFGAPNMVAVGLWGTPLEERHRVVDDLMPKIAQLEEVQGVFGDLDLPSEVLDSLGMTPYLDSRDGQLTVIMVQPKDIKTDISQAEALVTGLEALMNPVAMPWALTGIPVYALNDRDFIQRDVATYSAIGLLGVLLLMAMGFRRLIHPLLAVVALMTAIVMTAGLIVWVPGRLTLLSASFATLLVGLGIDGGIHIIHMLEGASEDPDAGSGWIERAIQRTTPGLWTGTLTTCAVFLSLGFTDFLGFVELGVIGAMGVFVSFLAMISFLPALFFLFHAKPHEVRTGTPFGLRPPGLWLMGVVLVAGILLYAWQPLPGFDANYLALQPEASPAVQLERRMAEGFDFNTQFAGFDVGTAEEAETLVLALQQSPLVRQVLSFNDFELLKESGLIFEIPPYLHDRLLSQEGRRAVYAYPVGDVWESRQQKAFYSAMKALDPKVTGMPILGHEMLIKTKEALWISGSLGVLFVVCLVLLDFRSLGWGLLALFPVAMTSLLLPGLMSWLQLSLNPINVMAIPVIIGIAVDDGVHFIHRFRAEGGSVTGTMAGTGKSVLLTSLTNLAAFGCLLLSSHPGLRSFVALLCLGVTVALLLSLLVLPAMAEHWAKRSGS
jgi:predicted RND superfamily exporter protein